MAWLELDPDADADPDPDADTDARAGVAAAITCGAWHSWSCHWACKDPRNWDNNKGDSSFCSTVRVCLTVCVHVCVLLGFKQIHCLPTATAAEAAN